MTNHWADMANATLVVAWGCNPAENHPASIAHIGRARFPQDFFTAPDTRAAKHPAQLIVIDPRKTRTAALCREDDLSKPVGARDKWVRIRPGTDIAFAMGLVRQMVDTVEGFGAGNPVYDNFMAFLNQGSAGTTLQQFYTNDITGGSGSPSTGASALTKWGSKYTDARFIVNAGGTDYVRENVQVNGDALVGGETPNQILYNFPKKATSVTADANTVYNRLKAHVAPYTLEVTADICGCSTADIAYVANAFIANSRCSSGASTDPRDPAYRATTMLYAMGITQHTCGSQNVKSFAVIQTLMGNMGRAGGGINALRGIHNVQGSTDMGLLYGNIPAYSGNPSTQVTAIPDTTTNAFGKYMDALWGYPLSGTSGTTDFTGTVRTNMNTSYDDAYDPRAYWLQQYGFYNMTLKWFGGYSDAVAATSLTARRTFVDAAYSLWPKGNGENHIQMFRSMAAGSIKAAVVWGQNVAVAEPNQGAVRAGLYELDTLVVGEMFLTETAACSRKPAGVTYLFPAASHVEKAGSVTNSGRTLQWRYKAVDPIGNTKDDTEMLLRLAKAIDDAGGYSHIMDVWTTHGFTYDTSVFKTLFANPYGGYLPGTNTFNDATTTADAAIMRTNVSQAVSYSPVAAVFGSEAVSEKVYREMCSPAAPAAGGGTIWIYTGAYTMDYTSNKHGYASNWGSYNRAKCRSRDDNGSFLYGGWGYSWLVNRRVLYNNSEVTGDVADFFMGPDQCSRLFVSTNTATLNYSRFYRTIHRLADKPDVVLPATVNTASPHFVSAGLSYAGRFPAHVEPYETPRASIAALWGRNTKGGAKWDLVLTGTKVAGRDFDASQFPLVLTSIRCVEHFQGGPITRNNHWNVELSPEPWIELNNVDARTYGIKDGDLVKIVTARTEDLVDDMMPAYGEGWRAKVGVGASTSQRVAPGVVAIPWHWGEKGLSAGSRANDICIDAMDANTTIPEYKACLCRIEKI